MTLACFKAYDIRGKLGDKLNVETRSDSPAVLQHVRLLETLIRDAG